MRFDPLVWHQDYISDYQTTVDQVFGALDADLIDSVTLGGFRLPKGFYKTIHKLYPDHWLFSAGLDDKSGMITYREQIETEVLNTVGEMCEKFIKSDRLFTYSSFDKVNNDA